MNAGNTAVFRNVVLYDYTNLTSANCGTVSSFVNHNAGGQPTVDNVYVFTNYNVTKNGNNMPGLEAFKKALNEFVEEYGTSVLISSHSLRELEDFCDSYVLIDNQTVSDSGDITEKVSRFCKFQLAFREEVSKELFADLPVASLEQNGKFVRVVLEGDAAELRPLLEALNPAVIEEMCMDFEEIFIHEVEKRGYVK